MNTVKIDLSNWRKVPESAFPETPFYLYDVQVLEAVWNEFSQHSQKAGDYQVCFAMKANCNKKVLQFFKNKNCGVDVVSKFEMHEAINIGFPRDKIVFSGAGKSTQELIEAVEAEIHLINIESEDELQRLLRVLKSRGKKQKIGFRVNPDVDAVTHPYIATGLKNHKFGVDFDTALKLYLQAAQEPEFLNLESVSVHIGSQIQNLNSFGEAFGRVSEFIHLLKRHEIHLGTFDLGGGLGLSYEKPEIIPDFKSYFDVLENLRSHLPSEMKLVSELGRSLVVQSGKLITRVIGQKVAGAKTFLIIDASMTELLRPALYQARHPLSEHRLPLEHSSNFANFEVVGPVCESSDKFGSDYFLSRDLKEGDLLAFELAGAYGRVMANQYNLRPLPKEYFLEATNPKSILL